MRIILFLISLLLLLSFLGAVSIAGILWHYGKDLPDYKYLESYEPPVLSRVFAADGQLMSEYATEKRVFVPYESIPNMLKHAFIATEDKRFYDHNGVDFVALMRAMIVNIPRFIQKKRLIGASTITQQVAKNFLLTNVYSFERKIKEAILALRIESVLSKERILELYLNEIYLGYGAYGVAQAALQYFDKSLYELTIAEMAFLAALPKAPNNYHPIKRKDAAIERRNWVIKRMHEDGYINLSQMLITQRNPLETRPAQITTPYQADYFIEEVRKELVARHSDDIVLKEGLSIHTSLEPSLQQYAEESLEQGLIAYDRRHGYAGALYRDGNIEILQNLPKPRAIPASWQLAIVTEVSRHIVHIHTQNGDDGFMRLEHNEWARKRLKNGNVGYNLKSMAEILSQNDIILVEAYPEEDNAYHLRQEPEIDGAIIVMNPHNGHILAMSGGWSFQRSKFNRATQAFRQPGSALKPFVYLSAVSQKRQADGGFISPAHLLLDSPIVIDQGPGLPKWKPNNFSKKYYGLSPMRLGIEKSRNLMTIRLALKIGMDKIAETTEKFGIYDDMPEQFSMALGAKETSLLRLTQAYASLVNGGKKIIPTFIDRVSDRHAAMILRHDERQCLGCDHHEPNQPPTLEDRRLRLVDERSAFQIVNMLEGVVLRGTGKSIKALGIPLAGKTGTTNDSYDAWFVGFSPDLVVGVYTGFDTPRSLGKQPHGGQETGSSVAAPIFKDFMSKALDKNKAVPFRTPSGLSLVRINPETGYIAQSNSEPYFLEYIKNEYVDALKTEVRTESLEGIY
jgi:penicillin-binding protein 1A